MCCGSRAPTPWGWTTCGPRGAVRSGRRPHPRGMPEPTVRHQDPARHLADGARFDPARVAGVFARLPCAPPRRWLAHWQIRRRIRTPSQPARGGYPLGRTSAQPTNAVHPDDRARKRPDLLRKPLGHHGRHPQSVSRRDRASNTPPARPLPRGAGHASGGGPLRVAGTGLPAPRQPVVSPRLRRPVPGSGPPRQPGRG
jgi:hypothetical protein